MAEWIPKANYPEGLASKVLELQSQKVNPWETLVTTIGKVGGKYLEDKKKVKQDKIDSDARLKSAENEERAKLNLEAFKALSEGGMKIPKGGIKDWNNLHKELIANPEYQKFKTSSVSPDERVHTPEALALINNNLPPSARFKAGTTVGETKAVTPWVTMTKGEEKFKQQQVDEAVANVANLNAKKKELQDKIEKQLNPIGVADELSRVNSDLEWYYGKPEFKGKLPPNPNIKVSTYNKQKDQLKEMIKIGKFATRAEVMAHPSIAKLDQQTLKLLEEAISEIGLR